MNYLAIDTSGVYLTVAVGGEKKAVGFLPDCALAHSVLLMDEIEKCLAKAGVDKKNIDVFACAVGPGSFTGIRIGVATVKALAYALGKKVLGVTSFDSLAYDIQNGRKKLAVINARHGNYYACGYDSFGKIELEPRFIDTPELLELSKIYEVVCDVPSESGVGIIADVKNGFIKAVESSLNLASSVVESLVPLYVKKSQAEEEA